MLCLSRIQMSGILLAYKKFTIRILKLKVVYDCAETSSTLISQHNEVLKKKENIDNIECCSTTQR